MQSGRCVKAGVGNRLKRNKVLYYKRPCNLVRKSEKGAMLTGIELRYLMTGRFKLSPSNMHIRMIKRKRWS